MQAPGAVLVRGCGRRRRAARGTRRRGALGLARGAACASLAAPGRCARRLLGGGFLHGRRDGGLFLRLRRSRRRTSGHARRAALLRQLARRYLDDFAGVDLEHRHRLGQALRLFLQRARGVFHQRRVLLRHFVHLRHRAIDLIDAAGLLFRRRRDLAHDVRHALDRRHDLLHRRARSLHLLRARADLADRILDQALDLLGRLRCAAPANALRPPPPRSPCPARPPAPLPPPRSAPGCWSGTQYHRSPTRSRKSCASWPKSPASSSPLPTPPNRRARPRPTRWPPADWPGARCPRSA